MMLPLRFIDARLAASVVLAALILVAEHFIRGCYVMEHLLGVLVPSVSVRVVLQGQLPVGLLDIRVLRILL